MLGFSCFGPRTKIRNIKLQKGYSWEFELRLGRIVVPFYSGIIHFATYSYNIYSYRTTFKFIMSRSQEGLGLIGILLE